MKHEKQLQHLLSIMLFATLAGCITMVETKQTASIDDRAELNGAGGNIFRVDPDARTFQLLKETAFDPKTNEGRSRYTIHWTDKTRFVKVVRQNSFQGLEGEYLAHFPRLSEDNAEKAGSGEDFVVMHVTILAPGEDGEQLKTDKQNLVLPFEPDPASNKFRGGTVSIDGKPVGVRLRGPRAQVDIRTVTSAKEISDGFWGTRIHGQPVGEKFVVDKVEIYPKDDPRRVDDPKLPRILVVGDSISMNYHGAAKKALEGVANYHRAEGNCGPSDRGVVCMELWLGDYSQPGLQWDVIQFNHGLHDLKQVYDKETGEYGAYQVPIAEYKANLEKEIRIMKQTGAVLVWCSTTPVPQDYYGEWSNGTFGRRSDAVDLYNQAAMEVVKKYPEIYVNDLNGFISDNAAFDAWRRQKDVHFWDGQLQQIVGRAVAERLKEVLAETGKLPQ